MKILNRIPAFLRNRYALVAGIFVIWLLFFENVDIIALFRYQSELKFQQEEVIRIQADNEKVRKALHDLSTNPETLEKFAREQYFMKKQKEDIFVFIEREED